MKSKLRGDGYVLANGVTREEANRLRAEFGSVVISRNSDGTYRVTRNR